MRNYIKTVWGHWKLKQINPNPPPEFLGEFDRYDFGGDKDELQEVYNLNISGLNPHFFVATSLEPIGNWYLLLNKQRLEPLIEDASQGAINPAAIGLVDKSPRKSWSHGH